MLVPSGNDPAQMQVAAAAGELEALNHTIRRYGLALTAADARAIVAGRLEALEFTDRVEFGGGVAKELVRAFASSPHMSRATFADTVIELQELFYEFKNESLEQVTDDELIAKMRGLFDEVAGGDLTYLEQALFEGLARRVREEAVGSIVEDDAADPDADRAAMNAHTLAQHRFDVSSWVDETYSPPWEGSSWLDE